MPKINCPQCGAEAECFAEDISWIEFFWEYTLICGFCGNQRKEKEYGGSKMSVNWETICPFCNKKQSEHQEPPPEPPKKESGDDKMPPLWVTKSQRS